VRPAEQSRLLQVRVLFWHSMPVAEPARHLLFFGKVI
jgi:hypothetical protein